MKKVYRAKNKKNGEKSMKTNKIFKNLKKP